MGIDTASDSRLAREAPQSAAAWTRLLERIEPAIRATCRLLCPQEGDAAFAEVVEALRADDFRRLRAYDGSSRLASFAALAAREILAERLLRLFDAPDSRLAWSAFESVFRADIQRVIARRMPGPDLEQARLDAYQDVCLGLIAEDCRRIKAYGGRGSFTGFVLHVADRLAIDSFRRSGPTSRRGDRPQGPAMASLSDWDELPSDAPNPEDAALEREEARLLAQAAQALRDAAQSLSEPERLYLSMALGGAAPLPAREVARLMSRPVAEIYKLKQRVMTRLRDAMAKHPAVKNWRASV